MNILPFKAVDAQKSLATGCKEETKFHVGGRNGGGVLADVSCLMLFDKTVDTNDLTLGPRLQPT